MLQCNKKCLYRIIKLKDTQKKKQQQVKMCISKAALHVEGVGCNRKEESKNTFIILRSLAITLLALVMLKQIFSFFLLLFSHYFFVVVSDFFKAFFHYTQMKLFT